MRIEKTKEIINGDKREIHTVVIEIEEDPQRPQAEQLAELLRMAHEFTGGMRVEVIRSTEGKPEGWVWKDVQD